MEEVVQEKVVPTDSAASGDFGEGALELEQQLLDKMNQPETTDEPAEEVSADKATDDGSEVQIKTEDTKDVKPPVKEVATAEPANVPLFDIDGNLNLKAGDKLTDEHLKELERGFLRQADYTRKTQDVARVRDAANEVLAAKEAIDSDPRQLRQHFEDKQILSAFSPLELLNIGLSSAKVPVEAWNAFKEWYKDAGYNLNLPTANPHMQEFAQLSNRLEKIGKTVEQFQKERADERERGELTARQKEQEDAKNREFSRIDKEVESAISKYKDTEFPIEKEDLLVEMVKSNGTKTVADLAKALHDKYSAKFGKYIKSKTIVKNNSPKPIKGQPVNIVQRQPKSFDEADALIDQVYGTGSLKQRIG
jgi:hypothetical protein